MTDVGDEEQNLTDSEAVLSYCSLKKTEQEWRQEELNGGEPVDLCHARQMFKFAVDSYWWDQKYRN